MPYKHLIAVLLVVSLGAAWAGARGRARPTAAPVVASTETRAREPLGVEIAAAQPGTDTWSNALNGYIDLDESKTARVGVPLSGRVVRVLVELGSEVKAGDPLFSVSSPELPALHAETRRAQIEVESAEIEVERVSALVAANALPGRTGRSALLQLETAKLGLRAARAKHHSLSLGTVSNHEFTVRAPRSGRVVGKHVLPGQQLMARNDRALVTLSDLSTVWLVADLFDAEADALSLGSPLEIALPTLPGRKLDGRIADIGAVVDDHRRTVRVRVPLSNPDGALKINALAKVRFLSKAPQGSASVETSALRSDGERSFVYVRAGVGNYERREVTHGALPAERALILSGIVPGEEVVTRGMSLLDSRMGIAD